MNLDDIWLDNLDHILLVHHSYPFNKYHPMVQHLKTRHIKTCSLDDENPSHVVHHNFPFSWSNQNPTPNAKSLDMEPI